MALMLSRKKEYGGGLQPNTYVPYVNSGFNTRSSYTDGNAITLASSPFLSGAMFGIKGKSTVTCSVGCYYCLVKNDGTVINNRFTANTAVDVTDCAEINVFDISSSSVASYTVTIA